MFKEAFSPINSDEIADQVVTQTDEIVNVPKENHKNKVEPWSQRFNKSEADGWSRCHPCLPSSLAHD